MTSQHVTKREITELFLKWDTALKSGDPQRVADRYARDAVLVPTLSNRVRTDRTGIVEYFTEFLKRKPHGIETQSVINILDHNTAVDTGTYRFLFGDGSSVDARYTFVYEKRDGHWLIINHHSSKMPEPAAG